MQQRFDPVAFGERLHQARINAGLTMVQAGGAIFMSQSAISRYEKGINIPTVDRLFELAKLYGCSMDWLCGLKEVDDDE